MENLTRQVNKLLQNRKSSRLLMIGVIGIAVILVYRISQSQGNNPTSRGAYEQSTNNLPEARNTDVIYLKDGDTYNLTASIVKKNINGVPAKMLAYNGSIPGPLIKVPQGAQITINFKNKIDTPTALHSHGLRLENKFDGVVNVTQKPIEVGESFVYKIKFPDEGIYWYHPHMREDYAQELGLYGNFLVTPSQKDYWAEVDREETLFLDDIFMENGQIVNFSKAAADHALMGRFGNVMLVNGDDRYKLPVKQGERVRLYLTNAANTRVFNVSIPNTRMKLVGADNGKYEREEWVDSVVLGPSERAVVEVWFDKSGDYQLIHKTPEKSYTMGTIAVEQRPVTTSYLLVPRVNQDMINVLASLRPLFTKPADKQLTLSLDMMGNDTMMQNRGRNTGGHMMGNDQMGMGSSDNEKIEWEDTKGMMNAMSTSQMIKWKLVDQETNKVNMDIDWQFKQGDKVKVSLFNDPKLAHPMQHPIHIHGQRFLVTQVNGTPSQNLVYKDTVLVQTGDTVELLVEMDNPGKWVLHCHIPEHMEAGMISQFTVM